MKSNHLLSMDKKYKQFLIEILPLAVGFILQPFIHSEYIFTAVVVAILLISWKIKYYKGEWKLFLVGLILGFVFEALGGLINRTQYWENASLLGIPIWLPIFWGYGFIFIYRLGKLIIKTK